VSETKVSPRRTRPDSRRQELVDAALVAFAARGVVAASVDDIVKAAGVAKGTFYLYFSTKDDAVTAVAERVVMGVGERIEALANAPDLSPVDRLLAIGQTMQEVGRQPHERDLVEMFHRPENRAVHDRISEHIVARLTPSLTTIIADGVAARLFDAPDPRLAAAFVLASFTSLHHVVSDPAQLPAAIAQLDRFILRGLGFAGEIPT
jgi:AcrR family transcriptional regulator